jgi:hypothetical protein
MRSSVDTAPMQMLQSLQLTMRASLAAAVDAAGDAAAVVQGQRVSDTQL